MTMPPTVARDGFLHHSQDFLYTLTDSHFNIHETNQLFERTFTSSNKSLIGKCFYDVTSTREREHLTRMLQKFILQPQETIKIEICSKDHMGAFCWIRWEISPVLDRYKKVSAVRFIGTDITQSKKIEEEKLYHATLISSLGDAVISTDLHFVIKSWNKAAINIFGMDASEVIGKSSIDLLHIEVHGDTREAVREKLMLNGNWSGKMKITRNDGRLLYVSTQTTTVLDGNNIPIGFVSVCHDITSQHLQEEDKAIKLEKAELHYNQLVGAIQDYAIIHLDADGTIKSWNLGAERIKGYTADEIKGLNFRIFYSYSDRMNNLPGMLLEKARRNGRVTQEGWRIRKDGTTFWGYIAITAVHDANGMVTGFTKITRDLTERKEAEMQLVEKERRFRSIFNSSLQLVGILQPDGMVVESNQTALDFAGLKNHQVVGQLFWQCAWWRSGRHQQLKLQKAVIQAAAGKTVRYETVMLGRGKQVIPIDFSIKPVLDDDGKVFMLIAEGRDISDLKKLQHQYLDLMEQKKTEVINAIIHAQEKERQEISYELHDNVNQILATCRLLLEVSTMDEKNCSVECIKKSYNYLQEAIEEIRKISRSLNPASLNEIGLVAAVKDIASKLNITGKLNMSVIVTPGFDEEPLSKDQRICLFRIVQEQVNNTLKHAHASEITVHFSRSRNMIECRYYDNGIGFDPSSQQRGLGLNNIYNRVELMKGKLRIHTQPGEGVMLEVKIPVG